MFSIIHPAKMKPFGGHLQGITESSFRESAGHLRPTENYGHFFPHRSSWQKVALLSYRWVSTTHTAGWSSIVNVSPQRKTDIFLSPLLDVSRDTDLRHIMQNTKESIGCLSCRWHGSRRTKPLTSMKLPYLFYSASKILLVWFFFVFLCTKYSCTK